VRALEGHDSIIRAVYWYTAPGDNQPSYLLSAGDDKRLFVWNCSDWSRSEPVSASKKITCVAMTGTGTDRVVMYADKFGNVYSYPLAAHSSVAARTARRVQVSQLPVQQKGKEGGDEDEESADGLTLLLGHFSSITSMTLDHTAQHIVTADRDEKIRVSRYPNAYNICTFCLGHTQFVSKVLVLHSSHVTVPCVISAGGDGTVRAWHLTAGTQLGQFNLASVNVTRTDASEQELIVSDVTLHNNAGLLAVSIEGSRDVLVLRVKQVDQTVQFEHVETITHDSDVYVLTFNQHGGQLWIGGDNSGTPVALYQITAEGKAARDTSHAAVQQINAALSGVTIDAALHTQIVEGLKLRQYKKMSHKENKKRKVEQQAKQ
jgi:hypothetical protein